jgi:hypothetical protein
MKSFNIFPVDFVGTACGPTSRHLPVDNVPGHAQPGAAATSRNKGGIPRFNSANTSGCNAGLLSLTEKTKQQTS